MSIGVSIDYPVSIDGRFRGLAYPQILRDQPKIQLVEWKASVARHVFSRRAD
jgi:hypothetical protein